MICCSLLFSEEGNVTLFRQSMELLYGLFGPDRVWSRDNTAHEFRMSVKWPPTSPDLTPCDYWLFNYLNRKY